MKKFIKFVLPILLLLFVYLILFKNSSSNQKIVNIKDQSFANLRIDLNGSPTSYDISNFVGKTALEATEAKATVITNGTGVNAFIISINTRAADTKKHEFWEFDVNKSQVQVGAGSYIIKNHDEIEWKITNY
jgi:hypothetical protein